MADASYSKFLRIGGVFYHFGNIVENVGKERFLTVNGIMVKCNCKEFFDSTGDDVLRDALLLGLVAYSLIA